jgi:hypothetical protein
MESEPDPVGALSKKLAIRRGPVKYSTNNCLTHPLKVFYERKDALIYAWASSYQESFIPTIKPPRLLSTSLPMMFVAASVVIAGLIVVVIVQ